MLAELLLTQHYSERRGEWEKKEKRMKGKKKERKKFI
jgi:hypothetical protein